MAGKTTIRVDKRINTEVMDIKDKAGVVRQAAYVMLVDTGGLITIVGYEDVAQGGTWDLGPIVQHFVVGGQINLVELRGGMMTIETEPQGGGAIQNKTCGKMYAIPKGDDLAKAIGGGAKGLLGMDQLDAVGADPQKSAAGNTARMARRV
jgi:hypothetical protein